MNEKNFNEGLMNGEEKFERKIIESELKYRRLFEHLKEGIIISGPDGIIEEANPAALEMLGYMDGELIGQQVGIIYADMDRREEVLKILRQNHYIKDYQMPLKKKDGTIICCNGSATLHRDGNGNVLKVEGIFSDITEKKSIEKELVKSEKNYRTLVESTQDMIFRGELDGRIIFTNKAVEKTLGYSKDELKRMNCFKGVHPDDIHYLEKNFNALIQGKNIDNVKIRYRVKNGSYVDLSINAVPVCNLDDKVEEFTGVARDMTALKKIEKELRKSRSIAEAYMEATTDAAVLTDLAGIIIDVNNEFARRFSKDKKELIGSQVYDLFSDKVGARRSEWRKKVIASGRPYRFQDERDGKWNDATMHPLFNEEGDISFLAVFTHDITEFKKIEKKLTEARNELEKKVLKRTAELEEVNTALRVLVKSGDADVRELEERILFNMNELILPNLEELKKFSSNNNQIELVEIITKNLNQITSQFVTGVEGRYLKLTPSEMKVANLVKQGKTNKEIAELYHLSSRTVESHRDSIRRKIGIKNKKVNLRSYLISNS